MSQIDRDDYCRRRRPVTVDEQLDIINEHPDRYSDLIGYFSLPLTNVEFKNDNSKIYWRVVGSSQWKVMFDFDNVTSKGMRFKGEVTKWMDIKQLIEEGVYDPQQGDVWKIQKNNNVIVYYQAHWVTLVQGEEVGSTKFAPKDHKHKLEDVEGLKEEIEKVSVVTKVIEQSTASDNWVVEHNLGRYPVVTVVDSSGNVVIGDVIYLSDNKLQVRFSSSFSGKIYLT